MSTAYEDDCVVKAAVKVSVKHRRSSLFTREDDLRLPLLTQLIQLQDGDEYAFLKHLQEIKWLQWNWNNPPHEDEIVNLRDMRDLARSIVEQLVDHGGVHPMQLHQFSDQVNAHIPRWSITGTENEDGYVPAARIVSTPEAFGRMKELTNMVVERLRDAIHAAHRFRRCDECHNPYFIQRDTGENRFCSERCSKRNYARIRRSKSKN